MFKITVNDVVYKVQFGYRSLVDTDVLDKVASLDKGDRNLRAAVRLLPELMLCGLQKHHHDKFAFDDEQTEAEAIDKVCDLLDDYEETEDHMTGYELYHRLVEELMDNGFLSGMSKAAQSAATEQNATVIPEDHRRKK